MINRSHILATVIIGLSIIIAAFFVSGGLQSFNSDNRYVSVRGLAEKEVMADLMVWAVRFTATGNDVAGIQTKIDQDQQKIRNFLLQAGFSTDELSNELTTVTDRVAQGWGKEAIESGRYVGEAGVVLRTNKIELAQKILQQSGEVIKLGVTLSNNYDGKPTYFYTKLNDIKPEMIAEATKNARAAAEQFARDSDSKVGAIRTASQGLFTVEPIDQFAKERMKVRVVTTVEYKLKK